MKTGSSDLYVYALAEPGLPRQFTILGRRLHRLPLGDVAAVIERGAPAEFTTESVQRQHDLITRLASREAALLPARFGSSVDEATLRSLVSKRGAEIREALAEVRGCVQMTIRVFGPRHMASSEPSPAPRSGTEFMERLRERRRSAPGEVEVVRTVVGDAARSERVVTGANGLLTIFHLVARTDLDRYRSLASTLLAKPELVAPLEPQTVTVTGPWPVFAFAPALF
jgi:Gas vesicle synthesis protein GvpL/GvpF